MQSMQNKYQLIKDSITSIPNYPHPPVIFRDITTLIENPIAFKTAIDLMAEHYQHHTFDKIVGTEARGFIFAAPLAIAMGVGLVPVRKPNKLPRTTYQAKYQLEYGEDVLEIHTDSIKPDERILIVDDLLATGGTLLATKILIEQCGGIVNDAAFVIDLPELGGQQKLTAAGINCFSLVKFDGL